MRLFSFIIIQFIWILPGLCQRPKLYVFLPSEIRPHAMRSALDNACPNLEIIVFPRYREFRDKISKSPPDAILALKPVTDKTLALINEQLSIKEMGFHEALTGTLNGKSEEPYVFLSEKAVKLNALEEIIIGAVDLLSRPEMPRFIGSLFDKPKLRVRSVTKLEDLLSLLQFQYATAILVPASKVSYYTSKSKMALGVTELPNVKLGLPVLLVHKMDTKREKILLDSFLNLENNVNLKLGVHEWSRR